MTALKARIAQLIAAQIGFGQAQFFALIHQNCALQRKQ